LRACTAPRGRARRECVGSPVRGRRISARSASAAAVAASAVAATAAAAAAAAAAVTVRAATAATAVTAITVRAITVPVVTAVTVPAVRAITVPKPAVVAIAVAATVAITVAVAILAITISVAQTREETTKGRRRGGHGGGGARRGVAVQVASESTLWKPGFHFIGYRVDTDGLKLWVKSGFNLYSPTVARAFCASRTSGSGVGSGAIFGGGDGDLGMYRRRRCQQ
jgi:hypothetical protein